MNDSANTTTTAPLAVTDLHPSEIAVEQCRWVREVARIDGQLVITCYRQGRLFQSHQGLLDP